MVLNFDNKVFIYDNLALYLLFIINFIILTKVLKRMKTFVLFTTIFTFYLSSIKGADIVKINLSKIEIPSSKKKVVVIDAGHGGNDSGTHGKRAKEKDLTLQMALLVGRMIENLYPSIEVKYTRTNDIFIPLYQRIGYANKIKADLFISIHCNYIANKNTSGTETYVMGLHRAEENLEVAKRENEVVLLENNYEKNYGGFDPSSPVGHILLSSFQDAYLGKSLDLAGKVEKNFASRKFTVSRGVKQAGFAVLRRATMPSILIETGFLSNYEEETKLMADEGQNQVCKSIAHAVGDFFNVKNIYENPQNKSEDIPYSNIESNSSSTITKPNVANEVAKGAFIKIQIAAMKNEIADEDKGKFNGIGTLYVVNENGYYKYQIGNFSNIQEAQMAKEKLKEMGYKGAFIINKQVEE